ncbi:hypothetical protein BD309DRAFT_983197 [Dichomitus squalens]|nr:hypothetical protein BD309DRAFT_983197 [Dichomitus squalens]
MGEAFAPWVQQELRPGGHGERTSAKLLATPLLQLTVERGTISERTRQWSELKGKRSAMGAVCDSPEDPKGVLNFRVGDRTESGWRTDREWTEMEGIDCSKTPVSVADREGVTVFLCHMTWGSCEPGETLTLTTDNLYRKVEEPGSNPGPHDARERPSSLIGR